MTVAGAAGAAGPVALGGAAAAGCADAPAKLAFAPLGARQGDRTVDDGFVDPYAQ